MEVHIDSGMLGMEFSLESTLPEFNQAGTRLNWSWSESFLEFENVFGDGYCTTWLEVLHKHFPQPLEGESKAAKRAKIGIKKKTSNVQSPFHLPNTWRQKAAQMAVHLHAAGGDCPF